MSSFTAQEIRNLFKEARRVIKQPGLDILIAPKTGSLGRLLVVTPRRTGNAPERNKIRRRLKAIFYEEKLFDAGFDCAVIVKESGKDLTFEQLKELLLKAVRG